jgi:hypothetical protein
MELSLAFPYLKRKMLLWSNNFFLNNTFYNELEHS